MANRLTCAPELVSALRELARATKLQESLLDNTRAERVLFRSSRNRPTAEAIVALLVEDEGTARLASNRRRGPGAL